MFDNEEMFFRINRLIMTEADQHLHQYSRPYSFNATDKAINMLGECALNFSNGNILPHDVANVASTLLSPSSTPGSLVDIPGGWNSRRYRYVLEVESKGSCGSIIVNILQGYTDPMDIGRVYGDIDPTSFFYINSVTTLARTYSNNSYNDIILESYNLIYGENSLSCIGGGDAYMFRPVDIFSGIELSYNNDTSNIYDLRSIVNSDGKTSTRDNALPSKYLSNMFDGYILSRDGGSYGNSEGDISGNARGTVKEPDMSLDPVLKKLARSMGVTNTNKFDINALLDIDIKLPDKVEVIDPVEVVRTTPYPKDTENWTGSDPETCVANILCKSISALLIPLKITRLVFTATNECHGGHRVDLIDGDSLIAGNHTREFNIFKSRFISELVPSICNNRGTYDIYMDVDLYGSTFIKISLNNGDTIDYSSPSYVDSPNSSVILPDHNSYVSNTHDAELLLNVVDDAVSNDVGDFNNVSIFKQ